MGLSKVVQAMLPTPSHCAGAAQKRKQLERSIPRPACWQPDGPEHHPPPTNTGGGPRHDEAPAVGGGFVVWTHDRSGRDNS